LIALTTRAGARCLRTPGDAQAGSAFDAVLGLEARKMMLGGMTRSSIRACSWMYWDLDVPNIAHRLN